MNASLDLMIPVFHTIFKQYKTKKIKDKKHNSLYIRHLNNLLESTHHRQPQSSDKGKENLVKNNFSVQRSHTVISNNIIPLYYRKQTFKKAFFSFLSLLLAALTV